MKKLLSVVLALMLLLTMVSFASAETVEEVIAQAQTMTNEELLLHNYHLTEQIYAYQEVWNGNPFVYVYHFAPQMEWQLYAAGIRLAKILNELYG